MIPESDIQKVLSNLNREINKIEKRTQGGITAAATFVRAESQKRTPVDTGNLRNSAYTVSPSGSKLPAVSFVGTHAAMMAAAHEEAIAGSAQKAGKYSGEMYAEIGYTAFYAVFVHEIDKAYTVGGWKFLEQALAENHGMIIKIIKDRAKV